MKTSYSAGAIGVLGIRKTIDGVYMYFAHNTDSFVSTLILQMTFRVDSKTLAGHSVHVVGGRQAEIGYVSQQQ